MDKKVPKSLNSLIQTPEEHFKALKGFYDNKEISLDEIINYYEKGKYGINSKTLNRLAEALATEAKSDEATQLYKAVLQHAKKRDFLGRAIAHYKLGNYVSARNCFLKIPEKIDGQVNPEYGLAQGYLEKYNNKTLAQEVLQGLFRKAGTQNPRRAVAELSATLDGTNLSEAEAEDADDESESTSPTPESTHPTSITSPSSSAPIPEVSPGFHVFDDPAIDPVTKERCRQVQTEKHFFSAYRTHKISTRDLAIEFQSNRQASSQGSVRNVTVENVPTRRVITADVSTVQASLSCFGRDSDHNRKQKSLLDWHKNSEGFANDETITLGGSGSDTIRYEYKHNLDTHSNHLGNFHASRLGSYDNILKKIEKYTEHPNLKTRKTREQAMARWMQRYASRGQNVALSELQGIYPQANQFDIRLLMQRFFHCLIKEPMRWMMPLDANHELPYATAQARAIQLIIAGNLNLKQVFDKDAPYGVFTGVNIGLNISIVLDKIARINRLYTEHILLQPTQGTPAYERFRQQHEERRLVTTRSHLHDELVEMYGGKSDTDGEGYDSDTAERKYPSTFQFR